MTTLEEYPGRCLGSKPEHPRTGRFLADAQGGVDRATTIPLARRDRLVRDAQAERQSLAASRPAVRVCRRQPKNHSTKSPAFPYPLDNAPARAHSPASNPEGSGVVHLRHPFTKEYDGDVGLVYMYSRWYSPEAGLFMATAPQPRYREHPYSFAIQRPTYGVDPAGRETFEVFVDAGGRIGKVCGGGASAGLEVDSHGGMRVFVDVYGMVGFDVGASGGVGLGYSDADSARDLEGASFGPALNLGPAAANGQMGTGAVSGLPYNNLRAQVSTPTEVGAVIQGGIRSSVDVGWWVDQAWFMNPYWMAGYACGWAGL